MSTKTDSGFRGAVSRVKIITAFLLIAAAFGCPAFAQKVPVKNVAVVETSIDEQSGAADNINKAEVRVITNEIRREAVKNLPRGRFNVMTSETVQSMGSAVLEDCAEENCVIALGSKIGADYIVRAIISQFGKNLTLSVEMYETEYGMLVATADPVRTASIDELLEKATAACAAMYKSFLETSPPTTPQPAAQTVAPPPPPTAVYTLAANANPSAGGEVTRHPDLRSYVSGTTVTVTAVPKAGYRFTGWSGSLTSEKHKETVVINSNMILTANFQKTYVLTTNAMPANGGSVSRYPYHERLDAGTRFTLTAKPAKGYTFKGWSDALASWDGIVMDSIFTGTLDKDLSLIANFSRQVKTEPAAAAPQTSETKKSSAPQTSETKKSSPLKLTLRVSTAALAAGGLVSGLACNNSAKEEYEKYQNTNDSQQALEARKNTESLATKRNVLYVLGLAGLGGFTLTFSF